MSPAFIAIDLARIRLGELNEIFWVTRVEALAGTRTDRPKLDEERMACISSLQSKLQVLFDNGLASPLDETSFGNTLLFVSNLEVN
jgi:hypothetical protein